MGKLLLLISLFVSAICFSQPGHLDPTFGNHGIVKSDLGAHFNYNNVGNQVLVQPDGSTYLVFANRYVLQHNDLKEGPFPTVIEKLLPGGSPDVSYGTNGFSLPVPIYGPHASIQSDGKIIVAGFTLDRGSLGEGGVDNDIRDLAVARFNTDGSLDNTFNGGNIEVINLSTFDYFVALAIQNDGKIIVAGDASSSDNNILALFRLNADGSIDGTFNETVTFEHYIAHSVALQSDGKVVVAGTEGGVPSLRRFNSDGGVDNTFNGTGVELIDFGTNGYPSAMAVQSDDKIIVGGYTYNGTDGDFKVLRLNINGGLDNTFDVDAVQTINFAGGDDLLTSISLQSDGKIIAAGYTSNGTNTDFALTRLNINGSLDNTFSADGKQTTNFGSSSKDYINSIAIQTDGKLVALGYLDNGVNTFVAAARYNTDGTPDMSFNGCGVLVTHINQGSTSYTCTVIQTNGKILAAGYTWDGTKYDFVLARYNTNGNLDNTFSGDGFQTTALSLSDSKAYAIGIQADGKIVVAGTTGNYATGNYNCGLARYNSDGSIDNTFGAAGMVTTDFGAYDSVSMAIQADGKILIAGRAMARYNTNGSLDLTFNGTGELTSFQDGNPLNCSSIALQNDGKIVITGTDDRSFPGFIVARYNPDGSPDNTFNGNGEKDIFSLGGDFSIALGKSIVIQSDGNIVVGGYDEYIYRNSYSQFLLTRLNTNGDFDPTFNGGNIVYTPVVSSPLLAFGFSMVIQNTNQILMGGYIYNGSSPDFTIVRYNADGSLDNTFGENGIVITQASTAYDRISGMTLSNDNLYAAGFGQYPGGFGVIAKYSLSTGGSVPVTFTDFTGILKNKSVLLQWQTVSEHNLSGFIIERSGNNINFSAIGNVAATGNSSLKINYSTYDRQPLNGINFYRLRFIDVDGRFTYSNIVAVKINSGIKLQIFPNPAEKILFAEANGNDQDAIVQIVDEGGRKLKEMKVYINGQTSFSVDVSSLPAGQYFIILHTKEKREAQPFIKR